VKRLERSALLAVPVSTAYGVVADVDAYRDFVPGCITSDIVSRNGECLRARLGFRVKGLTDAFVTDNRHLTDACIEMTLVEGPLRHLQGAWHFSPLGDQGCKVRLVLDIEFANRVMTATFSPLIDRAAGSVIDAFSQRMRQQGGL